MDAVAGVEGRTHRGRAQAVDPRGRGKIEYVLSSGNDIPGVADASVDAVWSFDVFGHIAPGDQAAYLSEVARVLTEGGVAIIHHSDGRNRGLQRPVTTGGRLCRGDYSPGWGRSGACGSSPSSTLGAGRAL